MPLPDYGVVIGSFERFAREDPNNYGSWYHGMIYLNTPQGEYQCAVDVSTPSTVKVQYQVLTRLDATLFAPILALSDGFHHLDSSATSGAIDFIRSPLFRAPLGCSGIVGVLLAWLAGRPTIPAPGWIDSTGDNALNRLETQVVGSTHVFVFGEPYRRGDRGVNPFSRTREEVNFLCNQAYQAKKQQGFAEVKSQAPHLLATGAWVASNSAGGR